MKKIKFIIILVLSLFSFMFFDDVSALSVGTYNSNDGHKITINEDNTILYDDTYSLTLTSSESGDTITGKIGSNNVSITFYELNDSNVVSTTNKTYTHNSNSVSLYEATVFSLNTTPVEKSDNGIELWRNGSKVKAYADLQSAVDAASSGDTIKLTKNLNVTGGAYINKNITIDGNNKTLNKDNWANSLFVIEEGITATINNLTIDGGAAGFEIDYSIAYPAVKSGSLDNDPIAYQAIVISRGNLNMNSSTLKNHYTQTSYASALRIISGNATIKNTDFTHNYGKNYGAAVNIGSSFKTGQTTQPVKDVVFENCAFTENYTSSGNGGGIYVLNTETIEFTDCYFYHNMASGYTAGGGAVLIYRDGVKPAESNNLPYTQAYFTGCIFEENLSGNDGYAIQNESAELYIDNCYFIKNEGLSSSSSVGTVSCMLDGNRIYKVVIKNSGFDGNIMGASVFGDHGTLVDLEMTDVEIKNNTGSMSILLYSANAKFTNVTFTNETVTNTVLDVRPYVSETKYPLYKPQTVILDDVSFEVTDGPTDVLIRRRNHDMSFNDATVIIENNVVGDVDIWDNTNLIVNGNLDGDVETDASTESSKVVVNGNILGEQISHENTYVISLNYPVGDSTSRMFLYLDKDKTYTEKELYMLHLIGKDGYKLAYYTDSNMTTEWNRTITGNATIYAKWVEHAHVYNNNLVVYENVIYDQCECGYLGKKLALLVDSEMTIGELKEVQIINELGIKESDYTVSYMILNSDGTYTKLDGAPNKVGNYKVVLTYNNLSIEEVYSIIENTPNTFDSLFNYIIMFIGGIIGLGITTFVVLKFKKSL